MATVRELITRIGFNVDQRKLDNVNRSVNNLKMRLNEVSASAISAGTRLTAFATVPIALIGRSLINAASDAEETASKFAVVFQDVENSANEVAANLSKNYGLSSKASKQLLSDTGDLLTGFGFTGESALDLSQQVNELAVDLASFTNFSGGAEGASQALTKALLGERESVKSLGISILEADVQAKVLENTQKGLTFETERQAKAYATLQIAQEQSKNAIGDFARTQDSFANRLRIFRARLDDASVSLGNLILPKATEFLNKIIGLIEKFNELSDGTKETILQVAGFIAIAGPILLVVGLLIKAVSVLISVFTGLRAAFLFIKAIQFAATLTTIITALKGLSVAAILAQTSFLLIPLAIAAVAAGLTFLILKIDEMFPFLDALWELIGNVFGAFMLGVFEAIKGIGSLIRWVGELFGLLDEEKEVKINAENPDEQEAKYRPLSQRIAEGDNSAAEEFLRTRTFGPEMTPEMRAMQTQTTKSVNVKSDIVVNVPAGTSEEQSAFLKQAAREAFKEEYENSLQNVLVNNPELE